MSAVTPDHPLVGPFEAFSSDLAANLRRPVAAGLKVWPLLSVLTTFWVYVAISNVLYAHSMQATISSQTPGHYFAPWDQRVVQHLLLYPILVGCIWASLRIGWQPSWRAIPAQLGLAVFFAALASPLLDVSAMLLHSAEWKEEHAGPMHAPMMMPDSYASWIASGVSFLLTYGFALALITGLALYQRFRDAQLRSAALERALTSAHLATLRMQLSPHTLFNLLHTIRGNIGWDPAAAQSMIVQLGDLLRRLLTAGERDFSRLSDELRFARLYLELQQKRFVDRLTIWMVDFDGLPPVWVPSLILQPLIENAVVHGMAGHAGSVEVRVVAEVCGENLWLRVINTIAAGATAGRDGIGLRNVRERLAVQFGERAIFTAGGDGGNWIAEIRMPLLRDGPDPSLTRDEIGSSAELGRAAASRAVN